MFSLDSKVLSLLLMSLLACGGSYSKRCWEDVCKIVENGVTRYEGDPEKIKQLQAEDQQRLAYQQAAEARVKQRQADILSLPKKPNNEVIKLAVMKPEVSHDGLEQYRETFYQWFIKELNKDPRIQVVPHSQVRRYLSAAKTSIPVQRGWNESGPKEKRALVPNAQSYQVFNRMNAPFDVFLYTFIGSKTQSGLVGGKGQGVGIISADKLEISGVASSIYSFDAHRHSVIGKSAGTIDITGRDKEGEIKSASIKNKKRNIQLDKPAAHEFARYYARIIKLQIASKLPARKALQDYRTKH